MNTLRLHDDFDARGATALVVSFDGWTDAGSAGTTAAAHLVDQFPSTTVGEVEPDRVFDFRDRRPMVPIDNGSFGEITWPAITLHRVELPATSLLVLTGAEPDFAWQELGDDLVELAHAVGLEDYVGLGSVPGPVPHTRPVRVTTTSNDESLLVRFGRAHEKMVVPGSAQVILEITLGDVGLRTLGMWARIPHYVAGDYPAAAAMLLRRLGEHIGMAVDLEDIEQEALQHADRLADAASESTEVTSHISALEGAYDADVADDTGLEGPLPTGDQIAEELERFLRNRD